MALEEDSRQKPQQAETWPPYTKRNWNKELNAIQVRTCLSAG